MTDEIEPRPTSSGDLGVVKAWAPVGAVAYVLGRINSDGEAEHGYWLDVESEIAHQRERGIAVVECDRRGEAVFTRHAAGSCDRAATDRGGASAVGDP